MGTDQMISAPAEAKLSNNTKNKNKNNILISVIIPVYNTEQYLKLSINSVLAQNFLSYEVILVDDGSTDSSPAICDQFAEEYDKVRVFHTENKGAAAARNYGIEVAKGKYIAFVDSDDTISSKYLSLLYNNIVNSNADISVCGFETVESEGKSSKEQIVPGIIGLTGIDGMKKLLYQRGIMSVPWGFIATKDLWEEIRFPEGRRVEDYATIYRLFGMAKTIVFNESKLYRYYIRKSSTIFSSNAILKNTDYYNNGREMIAYISEKYPECLSAAYSRHFSACFQILSETKRKEYSKNLLDMVYGDIRVLRRDIIRDPEARKVNRMAARLSYISIRAMHAGLRLKYIFQIKKMK